MQFRFTRMVVLVASLAAVATATSACGQYSLNSIRSLKAFKDGVAAYQKGDYATAATRLESAITHNPDFGFSYFYLANSYDNQFRNSRRGEPENDAMLEKAAEQYRNAIDKLAPAAAEDQQAADFRRRSYEFLIALYGSDKLNDFSRAEPVARELIQYQPNDPTNYQLLARLYEDQGDMEQAEALYQQAIEVRPEDALGYQLIAGFYNRQFEFDKLMTALQRRAEIEPNNPEAWHTIATYYYDKVYKDGTVTREAGIEFLRKGIEAEDKAISLNPDYREAVMYKELLLRLQANRETNRTTINRLLAEADELQKRAQEIEAKQTGAAS